MMKTMKNICKIVLAMVLLLASFSALAQQATVKGTVKDSSGEPVIGAVVMVEGNASNGAVTDNDGRYSLTFVRDKNTILKVSCLGYKNIAEALGSRTAVDFILEEDNELIDEVVVVGYGSMRRSDITGSVTSVKIDDFEAGKSSSLDQMLLGHAAGVDVINASSAPDAGVSIRIRGVTSLSGSSEPLYVVDGVIMSDPASGNSLITVSGDLEEETNSLLGINPNDIASMEILKDASATAIYGAAGANGVVLITTKQANKEKPVIRANIGVDYLSVYKYMDMLDFDGYVSMLEELNSSNAKSVLGRIYEIPEKHEGLKVVPVNWQERYIRNKIRQRYFVSISGRPKTMSYTFSLGYNNSPGLVDKNGVDQYTIRLNVDKTFGKNFKVGTRANFAYVNSYSIQGQGSEAALVSSSLIKSLVVYRPFLTAEQAAMEELDDESLDTESKSGPEQWFTDAYSRRKEFRITPSIYAQYTIAPWLTFKSAFGGDFRMSERTKWKGGSVDRRNGPNGGISDMESYRWNWDNTFMFNKKLGVHNLSGTVGMTLGRKNQNIQGVEAQSVYQYKLQADNLDSSANTTLFSYSEVQDSQLSFFARAIYNYKDRYVLTTTYRLDGSSQFRGANRFASFPSAAFAWRVNQEPWFNVPVFSMLKFRVGWGMVGNSSVSAYQTFNGYGNNTYGNHVSSSQVSVGIFPGTFSNEGLKWETTQQWNLGVDIGLFKGRLTLSADAYDKTTYDLLQKRKIPYSSGFQTRWVNEGIIRNKGLELSIDATPVHTRNFEWGINGNISMNRNRLESLGFTVDPLPICLERGVESQLKYYLGDGFSGTYVSDPGNIFIEGYEIGLFYGYKTDGIVQIGETGPGFSVNEPFQPGQVKYVDMNGDGFISDLDRTIIGSYNPMFTYGFGTSISYKNLRFSANFQGVQGRQLANVNFAQETDYNYQSSYNVRKDAYINHWTNENPTNKYMSLTANDSNQRRHLTDRYIEDGSYLRLASVALSYDIPIKKTSKVVKGLNVGVSGNNLFIWTKYSGWSPMVNSFGKSMSKIGADTAGYPDARTYCFDLKFTF